MTEITRGENSASLAMDALEMILKKSCKGPVFCTSFITLTFEMYHGSVGT
jgi:hypothetical protein